jgi:hypothetical protein
MIVCKLVLCLFPAGVGVNQLDAALLQSVQRFHSYLATLLPADVPSLCNPSKLTSLPFLWIDQDIPERIRLDPPSMSSCIRNFSFMGRCKMNDLINEIRALTNLSHDQKNCAHFISSSSSSSSSPPPSSNSSTLSSSSTPLSIEYKSIFSKLLVYGTPGWGKSYMMAAAAVLLRQEFFANKSYKRVVYLPDCKHLRDNPVSYMKNALLLSFADDFSRLQQIQVCKSTDQLIAFIDNLPYRETFLLFIADQTNKLTGKGIGDKSWNAEKEKKKGIALDLLIRASSGHFLVEAISINDSNKEEVAQKQENRRELAMFGELSQVRSYTVSSK